MYGRIAALLVAARSRLAGVGPHEMTQRQISFIKILKVILL